MQYDTAFIPGIDQDENEIVFLINFFMQHRARRVNFEQQWEESAALGWPDYVSTFEFGRDIWPGMKKQQFQVDSSIPIASHRFGAIVDWLVTPSNLLWSKVEMSDESLMRQRTVQLWCEQMTKVLWRQRYRAQANFIGQNQTNMQGLGIFGNMGMFIDEAEVDDPRQRGLRYLGTPVGEIYVIQDHQKRVIGFIRHFRLNAQEFKRKWPDAVVPVVEAALRISSQQKFDLLHFVKPRTDYHPEMVLTPQGKKWESTYLHYQGHCILERGGYRTLPLAYARYMIAPDEDYGRGPMQQVLASAKTKNAQKRSLLKQAHKASDPAYLTYDTGLVDVQNHAGAWNAGGMTKDGKLLVGMVPVGNVQINEKMIEMEGQPIEDAFLVSLFKMILADQKNEMGPRQVLEYINERGILLYPTVGGLCSSYLGPLTDRELDVLSWLRLVPPMPPAVREAKGDVSLVYTNPISRAMQAQESSGYVRTMEFAGEAVKVTGDPSLMDVFDLDVATREMGADSAARASWFRSPQALKAKRAERAKAAAEENRVKSLPGEAAMAKAKAIQAQQQNGQMPGGVGSGTPQGGMPMMPGQSQPGGTPPLPGGLNAPPASGP